MAHHATHTPAPGRSLHAHLLALVLAALLPVLLVGLASTWLAGERYRESSQERLQDTARALARAIEDDIRHGAELLALQVDIPQMRGESSSSLYSQLHSQHVFSVALPSVHEANVDATMPRFVPELDHAAIGDGKPVLSNLFLLPGSMQHWLAMGVPHPRLASTALVQLLPPHELVSMPPESTAERASILVAVTDGNGRIVARSRSPERYIGQPVPDWAKLQALGRPAGLFAAETTEGGDVLFAFRKLEGTPGWVVVVGEPLQVFDARWQQPLLGIAAGVLLAAMIALGFANVIARRVLRPVRALVRHSDNVASGHMRNDGVQEPFPVREFEAMRTSLQASEAALHQRIDQAQRLTTQLAASERRYRTVAEAGALVFWRREPNGHLSEATGWEELTGKPETDAIGYGWIQTVHPADMPQVTIAWEQAVERGAPIDVEFRVRDASGHWRWVRARAAALEQPQGTEWVGVLEDVDARRRAQARITYLAQHDALTGLANRSLFQEKLEAALIDARSGQPAALMLLDLDRFKEVNDSLGHPVGDALLRQVAARLQSALRPDDVVARLGGDEFAIVQVGARQPGAATSLAGRLVEMLRAPYEIDAHHVVIGASLGIVIVDAQATRVDRLLQNADLALYRAKEEGRDCFRFFEPQMDARMQARRRMETDLRRDMAEGRFQVFYQPLVDLRTLRLKGLEALLRWDRPGHGLLLPSDFLPLAEEIGLIVPLGAWVLEQACTEAVRWPAHLKVAVNLSPVQLAHPELFDTVERTLERTGLAPHRLELEITENALITNIQAASATLLRLKVAGVSIVMDDFGTGCSSLGYLRAFPFDKVKIDKSFVRELGREAESNAIIGAVSHLCATLGITATVEGVETQDQLNLLDASVCHEGQGFLFGEPCPAGDLDALLRRHASI